MIGAPLASVSDANSDERFLVSGSYLIFYHVNGSDVFIDRVLYGASFRSPICHRPGFVLQ